MEILSMLFRPAYTVQDIHDEFDSAYERQMKEAEAFLNPLKAEYQVVEEKAIRLKRLGFGSSKSVVDAEKIKGVMSPTAVQSKQLEELQKKYPFQKFLTKNELDRICKKYNLVYAPVGHYKLDVPEKNILEIEKCQPLQAVDKMPNKCFCKVTGFWFQTPNSVKRALKGWHEVDASFHLNDVLYGVLSMKGIKWRSDYSTIAKDYERKEVLYGGLQIAAPASEFDLKYLKKEGKYGFHNAFVTEIKDPIVFQFCKGDIVRVITKWGLEANDAALVLPVNN